MLRRAERQQILDSLEIHRALANRLDQCVLSLVVQARLQRQPAEQRVHLGRPVLGRHQLQHAYGLLRLAGQIEALGNFVDRLHLGVLIDELFVAGRRVALDNGLACAQRIPIHLLGLSIEFQAVQTVAAVDEHQVVLLGMHEGTILKVGIVHHVGLRF